MLSNTQVKAQEATLIEVNAWGSGRYNSAILHEGLIFSSAANSPVIDVQDPDPANQDGLIGKIRLPKNVFNLASCNGFLVADTADSTVNVYNVDDIGAPLLEYSVDPQGDAVSTFICDGDRLIFMDRLNSLYLLTYTNDTFELADVFLVQDTDGNPIHSRSEPSISVEGDNVTLVYYQRNPDNFAEITFRTHQFDISANNFAGEILKSLSVTMGVSATLLYTHSGQFVFQTNDAGRAIYALDTSRDSLAFNLISSINTFGTTQLLQYKSNQLWLFDIDKNVSVYDVSDFTNVQYIKSSTARGDNLTIWQDLGAFFLGERLYVRHVHGFSEIVDEPSGFNIVPLYYQGGSAGAPIVYNDQAYLARGGRIDVLDLSDVLQPTLEQQMVVSESDNFTSLVATQNTLIYKSPTSLIQTSDLTNGPNFEDWFSVIPNAGDNISRKVINDGMFVYYAQTKEFHRFDVSEAFSILQSPAIFSFTLPSEGYTSLDAMEGIDDKVFALLTWPSRVLMFDASSEIRLGAPQFVISESNNVVIRDISSSNDYLYALVDDTIKGYALDENDELVEIENLEIASVDTDMRSAGINVVDNFLIVSEFTSGTSNKSLLFEIQEDGTLALVSSSTFRNGPLFTPSAEWVQIGNHYIVPTYENDYVIMQINRAPVMPQTVFSGPEDTALLISLDNADPEGDVLSIEVLEASSKGALRFDSEQNALTFTPNADFFGETTTSIKLMDNKGNASTSRLSFTLINVNDAPEILTSAIEMNEDTLFTQQLDVTDADNDELSYAISMPAGFGTASINASGELTYIGNANYVGADAFDVKVTDAQGSETVRTIAVNVLPVNDLPSYTGEVSKTVDEDNDIVFSVNAVDIDSRDLVYAVVAMPDGWTQTLEGNTLRFTPIANQYGEFTAKISVNDGSDSIEQDLSIVVTSINDAPVASATSISKRVQAGSSVSTALNVTDIEDNTLTYTIVQQGTRGTASVSANGTLNYRATAEQTGRDVIIVGAADSSGASVRVEVVHTITAVPEPESSGGSLSFGFLIYAFTIIIFRLSRQKSVSHVV